MTTNGNAQSAIIAAARQRAYATFNAHEIALKALGLEKEAFWFGIQAHFKVTSSHEMKASQWIAVTKALEFVSDAEVPYANWIRDMFPETETETKKDDKDIPF